MEKQIYPNGRTVTLNKDGSIEKVELDLTKYSIEDFCNDYIDDEWYIVNGRIMVIGDVDLAACCLTKLPYPFIEVTGCFDISYNGWVNEDVRGKLPEKCYTFYGMSNDIDSSICLPSSQIYIISHTLIDKFNYPGGHIECLYGVDLTLDLSEVDSVGNVECGGCTYLPKLPHKCDEITIWNSVYEDFMTEYKTKDIVRMKRQERIDLIKGKITDKR